jgi:hypothetical protein
MSDSGDVEKSSLMGCDHLPLSTFRGIVVSLIVSGCCIGNVNTKRFPETSENTRPAKQCHIPEDMVPFVTTLVPTGYHRGHGTLYYHFSAYWLPRVL